MSVDVVNLSGVDLVVTDHYPAARAFDGGILYTVPDGRRVRIRATVFRDQTIEHGEFQHVLVKPADGGEIPVPLVLSHLDFCNNRGRELRLVMTPAGVLSHRFVHGSRRSLPQIIWSKIVIPFRAAPSRLHLPPDYEPIA